MSVVMNLSGELDGDGAEAFGCSLTIVHSLLLYISVNTGLDMLDDLMKKMWDGDLGLFQILCLMQQPKSLILYSVKLIQSENLHDVGSSYCNFLE